MHLQDSAAAFLPVMLRSRAIRNWHSGPKWTSLVCTLFLLMLCITGLPLIFYHEIDHATGNSVELPERPNATGMVSLDEIVASAQAKRPDDAVTFVYRDEDEPAAWYVSMAKTPD